MQLPLICIQPYHTQIIYPHKAEALSNYQPGCHGLHQSGMKEMQSDVIKWARKEFEILACSTWEAEFQAGVLWGSEKWRAESVLILPVSKWLSGCAPALHMEPEPFMPALPSNKTAVSNHMDLVSFPFCLLLTWEKTALMGRGEIRLPFRRYSNILFRTKDWWNCSRSKVNCNF